MNLVKNRLLIILLGFNAMHAKQTGTITTRPTQPIEETKFSQFPTYTNILTILKNKKPTPSDHYALTSIEKEAQRHLMLIQKKEPNLYAVKQIVSNTDEIKNYTDLYNALAQQQSPTSSDATALQNIIAEIRKQIKNLPKEKVQKRQVKLPYSEVLNALKQNTPSSTDITALNDIITEATRQKDSLAK